MYRKYRSGDSSGCLAMVLILVVAAPFLGVKLLSQDDEDEQAAGIVILGCWLILFLGMTIYGLCH